MKIPDVHIVFGDSAAGTLKAALRDLGIESYREKVMLSDIFSIGPFIFFVHFHPNSLYIADLGQ